MTSDDWSLLRNPQISVLDKTNLSAVTSATNGVSLDVQLADDISVFVNVSVNSGAVTVNIEGSHDGTTWFNLDSKTYTAVTGTDIFSYGSYIPFIRTTTTTQSSSTVTTTITGRT